MEIDYAGAKLNIHKLLAEVWPYDLPYQKWPTFCGAGSGVGDWIIPEDPRNVVCSCLCADHDIRWIVAKNRAEAYAANLILMQNLRSFIKQQRSQLHYEMTPAEIKIDNAITDWRCFQWYMGVNVGVTFHFKPIGDDYAIRKEIEQKLERLTDAIKIVPETVMEADF